METNLSSWLFAEAMAFLQLYHQEHNTPSTLLRQRAAEVKTEIEHTGAYWHTPEELAYGAKVAWRNSNRCIGRIYWKTLTVNDCRCLKSADAVFTALKNHIQQATNEGNIRSAITIFAPEGPGQPVPHIWNSQLIRYAGHLQPDGTILGDPLNVDLTQAAQKLGWSKREKTPFDVLPLLLQMPGDPLQLFELPPEIILEVPLEHPAFPFFAELGLKWHAVPIISNMRLEIGGISYPAAPFNGWYMGTEIGARNFGDVKRYNLLPVIAQKMGLDTSSEQTLWRDRALVELNVAVLHSFDKHGVTIIDHHTASRFFIHHMNQERKAGRTTPADWTWIVPPISGSATSVFHHNYDNMIQKPNYFYKPCPLQMDLQPTLTQQLKEAGMVQADTATVFKMCPVMESGHAAICSGVPCATI